LYESRSSPAFPPTLGFFLEAVNDILTTEKGTAVAKPVRKSSARKKSSKEEKLPLGKQNFAIIGVGVVVILGGYLAMLEGSVEGFLPLVAAPILLVLGYCVIIPFGILYKKSYLPSQSGKRGGTKERTS
jgi:hypothetical protein